MNKIINSSKFITFFTYGCLAISIAFITFFSVLSFVMHTTNTAQESPLVLKFVYGEGDVGDVGGDTGSGDTGGGPGGDVGGSTGDAGGDTGSVGDVGGDTGTPSVGDVGGDTGISPEGDVGGDTGTPPGTPGGTDPTGPDTTSPGGGTSLPPTCTLTASQVSITAGQSVTYTWSTSNADTLVANLGIGALPLSGTAIVNPTITSTIIITATGAGGSVQCVNTVVVTPVTTSAAPTCDAFTATPSTIIGSGIVTLSWSTTGATSVSINNGVGSVAVDGSASANINANTTYTLTATGAGGTVTCTRAVTVTTVVTPSAPTCDAFTASPTSLTSAGIVTLSWNTTGATVTSINNGVGNVPVDGSTNVNVLTSTTYTLTATGAGGTVTCTRTVTITPVVTPGGPTCDSFTATPSSMSSAGTATLSWNTTGATTVFLSNSIGVVAVDGSTSVSVLTSTTYTLTAMNGTQSATCVATVNIVPTVTPPSAPTCDAFTASPSSMSSAGPSTLSWSTTGATSVSINNGVGSVAVDGSAVVNITANTTYTLTATGVGGTVTCTRAITISSGPTSSGPTCDAFTASPSSLASAGTSTLSWNTSDATSVSINNGVGTVSVDGSTVVNVSANTTYTLTATGAGGTVTCTRAITIVPIITPPGGPTCDAFTAIPSSMSSAGTAALSWSTTGATSVSINNGVGSVAVDGSASVSVSADTTYTLTAVGATGTTTCTASVDISTPPSGGGGGGGGGGSSSPRCQLSAGNQNITSGQSTKLTWKNANTNDILLKDSNRKTLVDTKKSTTVDEDAGSIEVSPTKTTTYTLTAIRGSRERECKVTISVVSIASNRMQDTLALAVLPYTGFEAGPTLTALFYVVIVLWGMMIAYALVIKGNSKTPAHTKATHHVTMSTAVETPVHSPEISFIPQNLPTGDSEVITETDSMSRLEDHAHEQYALISSDALRHIESQSGEVEKQIETLDRVIALAKARYPKENEWIVINKERVMSLLS